MVRGVLLTTSVLVAYGLTAAAATQEATTENARVWLALREPREGCFDGLRAALAEVSDPSAKTYGQHWSKERARNACAPREDDVEAVTAWLEAQGLQAVRHGGFLRVEATHAKLASAFGVTLTAEGRTEDGECPPPPVVAVDFVAGSLCGGHTSNLNGAASAMSVGAERLGDVTPATLRTLYSTPAPSPVALPGSQALAEWEGQAYSASALAAFQKDFGLPEQALRNVTGEGWIGGTEANLDVQYILAVSSGVATDFWEEPRWRGFDLIHWIVEAQASEERPLVWSVSYGESMAARSVSYVRRLDAEFAKVGLTGVTILFASGDAGAYSRQDYPKGTTQPGFPAACPSVTSVGATKMFRNGTEDTAVNWSGGGFTFSEYFAREADAPWQAKGVGAYLETATAADLPSGSDQFDPKGVGFPDVSVVGTQYVVVNDLHIKSRVSGTSASCPVFAGIVALLNANRLYRGQPPMGHVAPFLYAHPEALRDIYKGRNDWGKGGGAGFAALPGWDPLTGFGVPDFNRLLRAALADGANAAARASLAEE